MFLCTRKRGQTKCALVTGVQTGALPICWRSDAAEQYEFGVLPSCKTRRQMEVPFEERRLLELDHVEILRRLDPYERRRRGTDTPCAEKAVVDALHHQREIGRAHV